ncbi:MAG: hypothetical protein ABR502_04835 [Chitinophagaceae bacterium]
MGFDNISDLPDWDDDMQKFNEADEGEEWKPNPTREACKVLYEKWQHVMMTLTGAFETIKTGESDEDDSANFSQRHLDEFQQTILADAFQVAVKIKALKRVVYMCYVWKMQLSSEKMPNMLRPHY